MSSAAAQLQTIFSLDTEWRARWRVAAVCVLLSALAVLPFFYLGEDRAVGCCGGELPVTHDAWMHFNQMQAFQRGLAAGRVYPRWQDDTNKGYGAPTTMYYPPGVYYLTSACFALLGDWRRALMAAWWLMMTASALALYVYARQTMTRGAALFAAAIYVVMPYHLLNQYQRGALAEQLSFVWMPLCLLFAERLALAAKHDAVLPNFIGLAACFGAFLWSHPPTAYQFLLLGGVSLGASALWRRNWRGPAWCVGASCYGSLLAAAYLYPAIRERHLINADDVARTWPYHATYVWDFVQTRFDHVNDPFFVRVDYIWLFTLALIVAAVPALMSAKLQFGAASGHAKLKFVEPFRRGLLLRVWLWLALGLSAGFMMTRYSAPLGRLIPQLEIGVFAWRMLAVAGFAAALLAGAGYERAVAKRRWPLLIGAAALLPVTAAVSLWLVVWPMWRVEAFAPNPAHFNYATMPREVPRDVPPMPPAELASGAGEVLVDEWEPEVRRLRVRLQEADQLLLRTFSFPGWRAWIDAQAVHIQAGPVGNIRLDVPAGEHRVKLEFRPTYFRRQCVGVTIVSFALLLALLAYWLKRRWA